MITKALDDPKLGLVISFEDGRTVAIPRMISCTHLYKLTAGYSFENGEYDAAQAWLAQNGYRYEINADAWVKP